MKEIVDADFEEVEEVYEFNRLNEQQKKLKAYNYALIAAQTFLFNPINDGPGLEKYRQELKSMINWLAIQLNLEGTPLYP